MVKRLAVILILLIFPSLSFATDYHVRKGGGAGNGTTWSNSWDDIDDISGIGSGDTVYIAIGTYTGAYNANTNGWTLKRATTSTHGSATGWSDGYAGLVTIKSTSSPALILDSQNTITIDGVDKSLFIIDGDDGARQYGIHAQSTHTITVKNITTVDFTYTGLRFKSGSGNHIITDNTLSESGWNSDEDHEGNLVFANETGVTGYSTIARNYFHNAGYAAASPEAVDCLVTGGSSYIYIYNNLFDPGWETENSGDMISIRGGTRRYIYNNVFLGGASNGNQNIFMSGSNGNVSHTYIYNNLFYRPMAGGGPSVTININYFGGGGYLSYLSNLHIYNNTFWGHWYNIRTGTSNVLAYWSTIYVKNNIFNSGFQSAKIYIDSDNVSSAFTVDNNYYYDTAGSDHVNIPGLGARNLTEMQSMGWDTNGDDGDAQADSTTAVVSGITWESGFFLTSSSTELIGQGAVDPGSGLYDDDYFGTTRGIAWDIGAMEYEAAVPTNAIQGVSISELKVTDNLTAWNRTDGLR